MPVSWKETNTALLPKEDLTSTKNYEQVPLLNNDCEMFSSILAHRLKEFSPDFIHEHQFGCLPERQLKDNMSTLVDVVEYL